METSHKMYFVIGLVVAIAICADSVLARTVIKNEIENTVNTGGNSSSGGGTSQNDGTITTGPQSAEVRIETTVNGEMVENITETISGSENIQIERTQTVEGGEVKTSIKVTAGISTISASTTGVREGTQGRVKVESSKEAKRTIEKTKSRINVVSPITKSTAKTSAKAARPKSSESFVEKIFNYVRSIFNR